MSTNMNSALLSKIAGNEVDPSTIVSAANMTEEQEKSLEELAAAKAAVEGNKLSPEEIQLMMAKMKTRPKTRPLVKDHKIGRNDTCPCGSGKKYKNCCMGKGKYETYHTV